MGTPPAVDYEKPAFIRSTPSVSPKVERKEQKAGEILIVKEKGCLSEEALDLPIDFDSLQESGAMMGSGGMVVLDEDDCMVEVARYFLDFTQNESCGKCTLCRLGTKQMLEILKDITRGHGKMEDLRTLIELAEDIKAASLCGRCVWICR